MGKLRDEPARRPKRRRARTLLLAAMMIGAGCAASPESPAAPETVVRAFLDALDSHDVERALSLLDEAFTFRSADGSVAIDRAGMPAVLGWDAAAEGSVEVKTLETVGDTVRVRLTERSRFTELLSLEPWEVDATFVVRDGRIVEEVAREVAVDGEGITERFQRALAPVRRWAETARPAEANALFAGEGVAGYDGPTARRLLRLLEDYRKEQGR